MLSQHSRGLELPRGAEFFFMYERIKSGRRRIVLCGRPAVSSTMRELSPAQRGAMRRGAFPPDPNNDRIGMNFCQIIDESIPPLPRKECPPLSSLRSSPLAPPSHLSNWRPLALETARRQIELVFPPRLGSSVGSILPSWSEILSGYFGSSLRSLDAFAVVRSIEGSSPVGP